MQQSHDAMVPGETCSHHENAHSTDEGGDVAHVGEAIPGQDQGTAILTNPGLVYTLRQHLSHRCLAGVETSRWCLRVASVRVADRLADSQGEESLVAGVGQRVDGLWEHARRSSVDPRQELEEEIQPIAEEKEKQVDQALKQQ